MRLPLPTNPLDKVVARVNRWALWVWGGLFVVMAVVTFPTAPTPTDWGVSMAKAVGVSAAVYAFTLLIFVFWSATASPKSLQRILIFLFVATTLTVIPVMVAGTMVNGRTNIVEGFTFLLSVLALSSASIRFWHRHLMREEGE